MNDLAFDVSERDVKKLQELYRTVLSINLDDETAYREAHLLLRQMELVYRPITQEQERQVKKKDENGYEAKDTTAS